MHQLSATQEQDVALDTCRFGAGRRCHRPPRILCWWSPPVEVALHHSPVHLGDILISAIAT